jgi:hypothetical protein
MNWLDDDKKESYFRFNVRVKDSNSIDDVGQMDILRREVHLQPKGASRQLEVASALLISSFYFELDTIPEYDNGYYRCEGSIRCRNSSLEVIKALSRLFDSRPRLEFTKAESGLLGVLEEKDICSFCQRYSKGVCFYVRHPKDTVSISLRTGYLEDRELSGFPQSVAWFIEKQQLRAHFGAADHHVRGGFYCRQCDKNRFRKRRILEEVPPLKIRRLS